MFEESMDARVNTTFRLISTLFFGAVVKSAVQMV